VKFITNNGLNENLREFFDRIIKPYIASEKAEFPWRNKKVAFTKESTYDSPANFIVDDITGEIIMYYSKKDGDTVTNTVFLKSTDGEHWEEVVSSYTDRPQSIVKTSNGDYYIGPQRNGFVAAKNLRSTDGLETIAAVDSSVLPDIGGVMTFDKQYEIINLPDGKTLARNNRVQLYQQDSNGKFVDIFTPYTTNFRVFATENYIWLVIYATGYTYNYVYRAKLWEPGLLNFTQVGTITKTDYDQMFRCLGCTDDEILIESVWIKGDTKTDYKLFSVKGNGTVAQISLQDYFATYGFGFDWQLTKLKNGRLFGRLGSDKLLKSDDNGHNWTLITNNDYYFSRMSQLDNGNVLISTTKGLWVSYDNGDNFELKVDKNYYKDFCVNGNTVSLLTSEGNIETMKF
jgi:hypothetical protein